MKKKLLFFGELEPYISHGVSISNGRILRALTNDFTITKVVDKSGYSSGLLRLFLGLYSFLNLFVYSLRKVDVLYIVFPTSKFGSIRVLSSIILVKLFNPSVRVISHLHRGDIKEFYARNEGILRSFMERCDILFVLSKKTKDFFLEWGFDEKVVVLLNTVESKEDTSKIRNINAKNNLLCISNYLPTKNLLSLIRVVNNGSGFLCDMYGSGATRKFMKEMDDVNSSRKCSIHGFLHHKDKVNVLRNSSFLVLPSLNEGMPLVILEAISLGIPVICYDIGDIPEYLGLEYPGIIRLSSYDNAEDGLKEKLKWALTLGDREYEELCSLSYNIFWNKLSPDLLSKKVTGVFASTVNY